jgi:coatomer subunit zeta
VISIKACPFANLIPLESCYNEFNSLHSQWYCLYLVYTNLIAILVLDSDGNRVLAKYYEPPHLPTTTPANPPSAQIQYITTPQPNPYPTLKDQRVFEKGLFDKTKKQSSDVILYDSRLAVYKTIADVTMYVIGGAEENEIMLYLVVVALKDCLDALLR